MGAFSIAGNPYTERRLAVGRAGPESAGASRGAGDSFRGQPKGAVASAAAAARRSGRYMPFGHWTAGLAAFQLGSFVQAADHFESMAESSRISGRKQAAAAFWAAVDASIGGLASEIDRSSGRCTLNRSFTSRVTSIRLPAIAWIAFTCELVACRGLRPFDERPLPLFDSCPLTR